MKRQHRRHCDCPEHDGLRAYLVVTVDITEKQICEAGGLHEALRQHVAHLREEHSPEQGQICCMSAYMGMDKHVVTIRQVLYEAAA